MRRYFLSIKLLFKTKYTCEEPDLRHTASDLILMIGSDTGIIYIYRSPSNDNISNFLSVMNNLLSTLSHLKTVVIMGHLNVDIRPTSLDARAHDYPNLLAFHGYLPTHNLPTRDDNCLDHIILRTKSHSHFFV